MRNEMMSRAGDSAPDDRYRESGGRDYLWFALFLIVVLVGVAGR